jgi:hypothetical protein
MNMIETDWWEMGLPDEWDAEQDDETILVMDEDGVGAIELSVLEKDEELTAVDWAELLSDLAPADCVPTITKLAECEARYVSFIDDEDAVRLWLVNGPDIVLVISYVCDASDRGMDDSAVDEILSTLAFVKPTEQ